MTYNSAANKRPLFAEQDGRCRGCLRALPYRNLTVDHILPQAKGGDDAIDNLQLLCGACNSKKGAGTHEELMIRLAAEGVIALRRGLFGRRYAPVEEGRGMGPIAVMAAQYAAKIAYDHREEIKAVAVKQAHRLQSVRVAPPSAPRPLARWRRRRKVAGYWRDVEHAPSCGCRRCRPPALRHALAKRP